MNRPSTSTVFLWLAIAATLFAVVGAEPSEAGAEPLDGNRGAGVMEPRPPQGATEEPAESGPDGGDGPQEGGPPKAVAPVMVGVFPASDGAGGGYDQREVSGGLAFLFALVGLLFTDSVRGAVLKFVFVPLYAKIAGDRLLAHGGRQGIVDFVTANPGATAKEIREALDMSPGTATHHLVTLERNGFLVSTKVGRTRAFFVPGQMGASKRVERTLLKSQANKRFLAVVRERPGITQRDLSRALDVTPRAVRARAARLQAVGLVDAERDGRRLRYRATST